MDLVHLFTKLALALVLGAAIGVERQWRQRLAGLRTNALVALGAASFTAFSLLQTDEVSPTRVAAQVVSGIGFLGGGVILREGLNVRGLNTAATLWCAAAVGVLTGSGAFGPAIVAASLVIAANVALRPLALRIGQRTNVASEERFVRYQVRLTCRAAAEMHARALLLQAVSSGPLRLQRLSSRDADADRETAQVVADVVGFERADATIEEAIRRLSLEQGIVQASWEVTTDE